MDKASLEQLDPGRWRRISAILDQAFESPAADLPALLERECQGDPELRSSVEALLGADRTAAGLLERGPFGAVTDRAGATDWPGALDAVVAAETDDGMEGRRIGPWRVFREIGRGGMGAVYLAERADGAFDQRVALKLIKRGLDTDEILGRFLRERRILARLEHRHIARLVDGGVTDDGRPWFAMEYVEGRPITAWCDDHAAGIERRLALFRAACEAVQHAHRGLVVHRDLKPSNIFVTESGEVKLLDFGIARLLAEDSADDATLTRGGHAVLTPHYAAPEQLRGEATTTATDLYSLGVVLYELLAGARPLGDATTSLDALRRAVLEQEPPPPSAQRRAWRDRLRGDLDNIVLTALRKEPQRRYPSVEALVADLDRYRDGLPVTATPPSARYRLAKFARRHRAAVAAGGLVALLLVAGVTIALWQAVAAALVVAALGVGLTITVAQARAARREARKAEEVKRFLLGVFAVSDPSQARGESVTARELLEQGARRIETELQGQPAVKAEVMGVLGDLYAKLGLAEPGLKLADRELALRETLPRPDPAGRAGALRRRGNLLILKGDLAEAEATLREAADLHRARFGDQHLEYAEDLDQLAAVLRPRARLTEAERLLRQALDIRRRVLGLRDPAVAVSLNNLAVMAREAGRLNEAEALYRESLGIRRDRLPADHPDICTTMSNLAVLLRQMGRYDEAERVAREALALHVKIYGDDHPMTTAALNTLGAIHLNMGRFAEAADAFGKIVAYWERHEGREHPNAVVALNNLAAALREQGDLAAAEPMQREAVRLWRERFGDRHPFYAAGLVNLAAVLRETGALDEAEQALRHALEIRVETHGEDHPEVAHVIHHQAVVAERRGDLNEAERGYRRALEMRERHLGAESPATAVSRLGWGSVLRRLGRTGEAAPALRAAEATLSRTLPADHPDLRLAAAERAALEAARP